MTERRTVPQTIRVAPEPARVDKHAEQLARFKEELRTQTTEGIMRAVAECDMARAPPGTKDAIVDELEGRLELEQGRLKSELGARTWTQLQGSLRRLRGTPVEGAVRAEMARRFRSGKFGPRSQ